MIWLTWCLLQTTNHSTSDAKVRETMRHPADFDGREIAFEDAGGVRKGDRVIFKSDWQDPGDGSIVFVAVDDESEGRVTVQDLNNDLQIKPTPAGATSMITSVVRP